MLLSQHDNKCGKDATETADQGNGNMSIMQWKF